LPAGGDGRSFIIVGYRANHFSIVMAGLVPAMTGLFFLERSPA
jgi:hypothetical protein